MAVSVIFFVGGEPDELLARYDAGWALTPRPDEPGLIYQACLRLPKAIKVIAHFATEPDARTFLDRPAVRAAVAAVTLVDGAPAVVPMHAYSIATTSVEAPSGPERA